MNGGNEYNIALTCTNMMINTLKSNGGVRNHL